MSVKITEPHVVHRRVHIKREKKNGAVNCDFDDVVEAQRVDNRQPKGIKEMASNRMLAKTWEFAGEPQEWDEFVMVYDFNIMLTPNVRAFKAWKRLTNGRDFEGTTEEFALLLFGYAALYADAMESSMKPWFSPKKKPEAVIYFAANTSPGKFEEWYLVNKFDELDLDSSIEALEAGVPIEDIIA